jgi:hypothetical protein
MSTGADVEAEVLSESNSSTSSSTSESRLPDRLGTSVVEYRPSELLEAREIAGVVALASETGSQQNVSLFQSLQLRFSSRRPSSKEPAHREKTAGRVSTGRRTERWGELTCPHAEEVLDVSRIDFVYETDVDGQDWGI